jgi:hypothetical protein
MHEAQMHALNSFITLTYNKRHLPLGGSLDPLELQRFMKDLRAYWRYHYDFNGIRFLACGEYGGQLGRPHYHALLFGMQFPDLKPWKMMNGYQYYTSKILSDIWGKGFCTVGNVTYESAAYVARYTMKKITGPEAVGWYQRVDKATGEIYDLEPEFQRMSRNPGLGAKWIDQFYKDVYPSDHCVIKGKKHPTNRYYDTRWGKDNPDLLEELKAKRSELARDRDPNEDTKERLAVRSKVLSAKLNLLKRGLDET